MARWEIYRQLTLPILLYTRYRLLFLNDKEVELIGGIMLW